MGAAEWTNGGYSSPAVGSAYTPFAHSYEQSSLPTILPSESLTYNPTDYQQSGPTYNGSQFTPLTAWNEMEQYNYGAYGNGYQPYPCHPPPAQPQYPPTAAPAPGHTTMVVYPQLYSTVNQNQIHLHLHGNERLVEQYLGGSSAAIQPDTSAFPPNSIAHRSAGLEISENAAIPQEDESINQHQEPLPIVDHEAGDQNVWRPY